MFVATVLLLVFSFFLLHLGFVAPLFVCLVSTVHTVTSTIHLCLGCRCTAQVCSGTQRWPHSWFWPLRTTGCQSFRCGTFASPRHLSKSWRTTQGDFYPTVNLPSVAVCCAVPGDPVCQFPPFKKVALYSGEFSPYPGAKLTQSCCSVALKTTGSCAGTQTLAK